MLVENDRLVLYFIIILMRKVQKKPSNTDYVIAFIEWAIFGTLIYWVVLAIIAFMRWLINSYSTETILLVALWIAVVLICATGAVIAESEKYENDTDKTTNM